VDWQGERVELRDVVREDLPDRCRWLNDPEVTRFFTHLGAAPPTMAEMHHWYEEQAQSPARSKHFSVYAYGRHIGGAQLKEIDRQNKAAELGLFIGEREQWGKGYGTEITRLLLDYAFSVLGLHRVWLRVDAVNARAIGCYKKCGFIREGVFRDAVFRDGSYHDSYVMGILKPEYAGMGGVRAQEGPV